MEKTRTVILALKISPYLPYGVNSYLSIMISVRIFRQKTCFFRKTQNEKTNLLWDLRPNRQGQNDRTLILLLWLFHKHHRFYTSFLLKIDFSLREFTFPMMSVVKTAFPFGAIWGVFCRDFDFILYGFMMGLHPANTLFWLWWACNHGPDFFKELSLLLCCSCWRVTFKIGCYF